MKTSELSWNYLSQIVTKARTSIRVVLSQIPDKNSKAVARLYVANHLVADILSLLDNKQLSIRERECLTIFGQSDPFTQKKDSFVLTAHQVNQLLNFANQIGIELENVGTIVPSTTNARLRAELTEGQRALKFVVENMKGQPLENPRVFGTLEARILDEQLRFYALSPTLLPREAEELLKSPTLFLDALENEEHIGTFESLANIGVDLECLRDIAIPSEPESKVILRAMFTRSERTHMALRMHVVTEVSHAGLTSEVEITAKGGLCPVSVIQATNNPENPIAFIERPTAQEDAARRLLFSLGATASNQHRGFVAYGEKALELISKIANKENLPPWLHIDEDTLPNLIKLSAAPKVVLKPATEGSLDQLIAQIQFPDQGNLDISFTSLLHALQSKAPAILLDDDTLLTFSEETAKTIVTLSEILGIESTLESAHISLTEVSLLYKAFQKDAEFEAFAKLQQHFSSLDTGLTAEDQQLPATLQTTLRPYQHDAVAWLSQLHRLGLSQLLADDMGLGKTLMVLTLLAKLKEKDGSKPNLIVAPTSVIDVWIGEARKHFADLKVVKWHGVERGDRQDDIEHADLVVTSYALLRRDADAILQKVAFRYFVLDEAQNIKNPRTESWKSAATIRSDHKIALSGTPIENRVDDLWSILSLISPGILGSERSFQKRYAMPISRGNPDRLWELKKRTQPIILRRRKGDVESDLPAKIENTLMCELGASQQSLYLQILHMARTSLANALEAPQDSKLRLPLLAALTRLRQVCCDPKLLDTDGTYESAKLDLLRDTLNDCLMMDRRIIIYSQFVKMQEIILELLKEMGVTDALWLHGATRNRGELVERFQDPNGPKVIVVSLKAGGTGITLTAADTVIHYDPWWNPAVEDQATDRAHRIGQKKTVHVIKLVAKNTIEEQIVELAKKKRIAAEGVLSHDVAGPRSLTLDDIKQLLSYEEITT